MSEKVRKRARRYSGGLTLEQKELQEVICSRIFLSDLPEQTFAARNSPLQEERIAFPLQQPTLKNTEETDTCPHAPFRSFHCIVLMKMPFKYVFPLWRSQLGLRAHYETGLSRGVSGGSD